MPCAGRCALCGGRGATALPMGTFFAGGAVEGDYVWPIARCGAEIFAHGVIADVAEFFGVVCIVANARIEEVALKAETETR